LGDLPLLGWLFKGKEVSKTKINMVVFLTPRIIRNDQDQKNLVNYKTQDRLNFIKQQGGGKDPFGATMDRILKREARAPQSIPASEDLKIEDEPDANSAVKK
jgi:general secretion pathway protein D